VAWLVGKGRKLDVLSIVRRKGALGLLAHSETEERFTKTRSELRALIEIAFGGMVAEEVFFGESSSGVAGDLKAATDWACQMIGALGMGSTLVSSASLEVPGAGNLAAKVLATDSGREEVESVLRDAKDSVRTMIEAHRGTVVALRDALLDRNELVGDEILTVIEGARPGPAALGALGRGPGRLG
jgi:ATP-dependent Zn protease